MITMTTDIQKFAQEWINSWNSHNLNEILKHYSHTIEITTPMIRLAAGIERDSLRGKMALRDYWEQALNRIPDLHFELIEVTRGVNSIALYYKSVMSKKCIEVMFFDDDGKVDRMFAYYT